MSTTLAERLVDPNRSAVQRRPAAASLASLPRGVLGLQRLAGNAATTKMIQRSCCSSCAKGKSCDSEHRPPDGDPGLKVQRWLLDDEDPGHESTGEDGGWISPGEHGNDATPSSGSQWTSGGTASDGHNAVDPDADLFDQIEAFAVEFMQTNFASLREQARVVAVKKGSKLDAKTCAELVIKERAECDNDTEWMSKTIEYGIGALGAAVGLFFGGFQGAGLGGTIGLLLGDVVATYVKTRWTSDCAQAEAANQNLCNGTQGPPAPAQPADGGAPSVPKAEKGVADASKGLIPGCFDEAGNLKERGAPNGACRSTPCMICFRDGEGNIDTSTCTDVCGDTPADTPVQPPPAQSNGCQTQCNQGPVPQPMIRRGSGGPSVGELQEKLNSVIIVGQPLVVDCDFGPATDEAVRQFQANESLGADGIVGPKTWGRLDALAVRPLCTA